MGLIFNSFLKSGFSTVENISNQFFEIPKKFLSFPFKLSNWNTIEGIILAITSPFGLTSEDEKILGELNQTPITLYIQKIILGTADNLYIRDVDWEKIRDYGILPDRYVFTLKLTKILQDNQEIQIYSRRDVYVDT